MTLVVTVNAADSIWVVADRRLSSKGRPPKDDGVKLMMLETRDGVSILGYAGLGATKLGTQPADWMSAVLRGRNLALESSLRELAGAIQRQFPRHMVDMPRNALAAHTVVATAFVNEEVRLYTIDLVFAPDRKSYKFRYTRLVTERRKGAQRTPSLAIAGSGAPHLLKDRRWMRRVLRLVKAHDRGRVSAKTVADALAALNHEVHLKEDSVGPRCIVAWRYRKSGIHKGGGGHRFYTGNARDASNPSIPTIANGMDLQAFIGTMMPHFVKQAEAMRSGKPTDLPANEVNADLARIPEKPDENLR